MSAFDYFGDKSAQNRDNNYKFAYRWCHIDQNPYRAPSLEDEGQSKHKIEPSAFATAFYVLSMLYPTIVTMAVYMTVMIGDNTGLEPHEWFTDSIASLAINTSALINMAGIGLIPCGVFWTFFPPAKELLFGTRYVVPARIMYLLTGIAAFVLLWLDPFCAVSRYQM